MCFQKGQFPSTDLAENLCMEPQKPPRSKFKSWQMGFCWPKNIVKGSGIEEGWNNTWGTRLSTTVCSSTEVTSARYPPLSKSYRKDIHPRQEFFTGYSPLPSTLNQIFWYRFQMHINPTTTTTDLGVFIDIILKPCLAIVEGLTPVHRNNGLMVAIWACLGSTTSVFVKVIFQSISELSLDV